MGKNKKKIIKPNKGYNPFQHKDFITFLKFVKDNPDKVKQGYKSDSMVIENGREIPVLDFSLELKPIPDGNIHTMPTNGFPHIEHKDCWCQPTLAEDFTTQGGKKLYIHKEIQ